MGATERIKEYIDFKGITKYQFNKNLGFSNKFLDNSSNMGTDKACKILHQFPDINPEWLLTGKGSMLKNVSEVNAMTLRTDKTIDDQSIPLYDLSASASVVEVLGGSKVAIPMDHIRIPNLPKCDGALHITGDSMYPLLKSGDIVLYREVQDKQNIVWGEMYLVYIDNNGDEFFFCKYIHHSDKDGYVKLVSQNKHHQPVEFSLDSIKQLAIVKASIRVNSVV